MKYLITGGAGFIGSHLADRLVERGDQVLLLDDLSTGSRANVSHLLEAGRAELIEGCVTDARLVAELMRDADRCVHLASAVGVQLIVARPLDTMQRNTRGMETVIDAASRAGVRLVVASTSEIYGKSDSPLHEDSDRLLGAPTLARWTYANAKAHGEMLAYGYAREHGAENIVVRFFNTVGPRQTGRYGMVLPRFVDQALAGRDLTVYGSGNQSRFFTHVSDSVEALLGLIEHDDAIGRPFNVGRSAEVTIRELAERVIEMTGSGSRIRQIPYAEAYGEGFEELGRRWPDTSRIEALTGWRARLSVEAAIADIIDHQRAAKPEPLPV